TGHAGHTGVALLGVLGVEIDEAVAARLVRAAIGAAPVAADEVAVVARLAGLDRAVATLGDLARAIDAHAAQIDEEALVVVGLALARTDLRRQHAAARCAGRTDRAQLVTARDELCLKTTCQRPRDSGDNSPRSHRITIHSFA